MKSSDSTAANKPPAPRRAEAEWLALGKEALRLQPSAITSLFETDPRRFERYAISHDGLLADFSKQLIDDPSRSALVALFEQRGTREGIRALFDGAALNFTENRPALHMACRGSCPPPPGDAEVVRDTSQRMRAFARKLHAGELEGCTGRPIERVVNLGIGGSDLGPRMAAEALCNAAPHAPQVRFVANIDPRELDAVLAVSDPHTTLFIVSSKSFTTIETLENARAARKWLKARLGEGAATQPHFAAITNGFDAATAFGIAPERIFALPGWVGGRYSVWSAIGLPLLIAVGEQAFDQMLAGGRAIDAHFLEAPPERNIPVMMALTGIWNINGLGIETHAILPYAHGLRSFPAWLQQLDMESNGKQCRHDGTYSQRHTAPVVWGAAGTVGQHAFHQLLYQGTRRVALDFIVPVLGSEPREQTLLENALAQSEALMRGRTLEQSRQWLEKQGLGAQEVERLAPHLVCPGNQPGTTLILPGLTPYTLGQLMALYEHKVFVQGWLWGINSFDQYGVELGKDMARRLAEPDSDAAHPATAGLLAAISRLREQRH